MPRFPWGEATVTKATPLGDDGRHLELDVPGWDGALAGQHIDVRILEGESKTVRSYSLSSGPNDRPQISVEKVDGGKMSTFLVDEIAEGDVIDLRGPIGSKFLYTEENAQRPTVFIGGGSGIAPFRGMWRAAKQYGGQTRVIYSVRTRDKAWFLDELEQDDVDLVLRITRGPEAQGRLTSQDLQEATQDLENPMFYVCGPNAFVDFIDEALLSIGIPTEDIDKEKWG